MKCAHSLGIVGHHLLADVIAIAAVAIRIAAQPANLHRVGQRHVAVRPRMHEVAQDSLVSALGIGKILSGRYPLPHALRQRIHKHARRRRLQVVSLRPGLVQHLVPQPGRRILIRAPPPPHRARDIAINCFRPAIVLRIKSSVSTSAIMYQPMARPQNSGESPVSCWPSAAASIHPIRDRASPSSHRAHALQSAQTDA